VVSSRVTGELDDRAVWCERSAQHGESAVGRKRRTDRIDHLLVRRLLGARRDLADRASVHGALAGVEQVRGGELAQHQGDASRLVEVECGVAPPWNEIPDDGGRLSESLECLDLEREIELSCDGEQVQHRVRRSCGRANGANRVLQRTLGDECARANIIAHELHGDLPGPFGGRDLVWVRCGDAVQPSGGEAEHLHRHAHRVRGELAAACAGPRTGGVLQRPELVGADLPGAIRTDRLEDALHGDVFSVEGPGKDRAVVEDEARNVQATEGHRGARARLVAAGEADDAVEAVPRCDELDGVGDEVARDERRLHPFGAHGHTV